MIVISSFSLSRAACFWARASSFFSIASVLRSMFSSFCCKRRSCFCRSARRSFSSFSYSLRERRISSFASSVASRFLLSALLMASLMMRSASSSALAIFPYRPSPLVAVQNTSKNTNEKSRRQADDKAVYSFDSSCVHFCFHRSGRSDRVSMVYQNGFLNQQTGAPFLLHKSTGYCNLFCKQVSSKTICRKSAWGQPRDARLFCQKGDSLPKRTTLWNSRETQGASP